MTITHVIGYIAKQILNIVNKCHSCKFDLLDEITENKLINVRNYTSKKSLQHPSSKLFTTVGNILSLFSKCKSIIFSSLYVQYSLVKTII